MATTVLPIGVVFDGDDRWLVYEERQPTLLRCETDGCGNRASMNMECEDAHCYICHECLDRLYEALRDP